MVIKKARIGNEIMRIMLDEDLEDPRTWDNLGTMYCWHKRYRLGDNCLFYTPPDFKAWFSKQKGVILNLYLYDHSGITMSWERKYPYTDRWDAMEIGYIFVTYESIKKSLNRKKITTTLVARVIKILKEEVKIYDQYLRGEVYGFTITTLVTCPHCTHTTEELGDSCFGFYSFKDIFNHVDKKWAKAEWKEVN